MNVVPSMFVERELIESKKFCDPNYLSTHLQVRLTQDCSTSFLYLLFLICVISFLKASYFGGIRRKYGVVT